MMMLRSSLVRCVRYNVSACRHISQVSTDPNAKKETKPSREIYEQICKQEHIDDLLSRSGHRPILACVDEPVIMKKFFVNQVDSQQLSYPEVIEETTLLKLSETNKTINEYFQKNLRFDDKGISDTVHNDFKQMNLYGYSVKREFGGLGYSQSERTLASEPEASNVGTALALNAHRLVCDALYEFGSDKQRETYLPKLAKGELVGTHALFELSEHNDALSINTRAEYDEDEEEWFLNGKIKDF